LNKKGYAYGGFQYTTAPLFEAIQANEIDIVSLLLDHGADINARMEEEEHGWGAASYIHYLSPLVVAIRTGDIDMVRLLLERGANVNTEGGTTNVPLFEAILKGRRDIARLLLMYGAVDKAQNVQISYDEYERAAYTEEIYQYQKPQTTLDRIKYSPNKECQEIVKLLRAKGAK
jgi:ankyrin repeat protein